jgi:hypothetical protein
MSNKKKNIRCHANICTAARFIFVEERKEIFAEVFNRILSIFAKWISHTYSSCLKDGGFKNIFYL